MENETKTKTPPMPYIPFRTFISFLANMKGKLPDQIDNSVLMNMSGTARSQLLSALKSLKLISDEGTVRDGLRQLSDAYNTPKWKEALAAFLKQAYAGVIGDLNIVSATPSMVRDRFKNFGGVEGGTVDSAIRFYIGGLKEAEVPFSPHIVIRAPRPTSASGGRKRTASRLSQEEPDVGEDPAEGTFRISFDLLGLTGAAAFLPDDIDNKQWEAVSEYVATVIGLRQRARRV
jgi:hypothetical protein